MIVRATPRRAGCAALLPASLTKAARTWVLATASAATVLPQGRAFIFGSGLAIVPFLCQGAAAQHDWRASQQFILLTRETVIDIPAAAIAAVSPGLLLWGNSASP